MEEKNIVRKVITIPTNIKKIFSQYLVLTKPLHGLRPKEIEVLALILYYNLLETPNFVKERDRWNKIFDYDTKLCIRNELGIQDYSLQNVLSSLRKKKVIVDNRVSEYFIPKIIEKTSKFQIVFNFDINAG